MRRIANEELVGGEHHVLLRESREDLVASRPLNDEHLHGGREALKLRLPVRKQRLRAHDQHRPGIRFRCLFQTECQRDALHRLAQTHFIGKHTAASLHDARRHPAHAFHLVGAQHPGQIADAAADFIRRDDRLLRILRAEIRRMRSVHTRTFRREFQRHIAQRLLHFFDRRRVQNVAPSIRLHRPLAGTHQPEYLGASEAEAVRRFIRKLHPQPVSTTRATLLRCEAGLRRDALDTARHILPALALDQRRDCAEVRHV